MKYLFVIIMSFFMFSSLTAQRDQKRGIHSHEKMLSHLQSKLDLSEEQAAAVSSLIESHKNQEGKSSRKELMESIKSVLDDNQKAIVKDMKFNRKKGHSKKGKRSLLGEHKKMDEESLEKLKEMRRLFDEDISSEDKEIIEHLRHKRNALSESMKLQKESFKNLSKEDKLAFKKAKKEDRKAYKEDFKELKPLLEKYKDQIKNLFEENQSFFKEKKKKSKEKFKKPEQGSHKAKEGKMHKHGLHKRKAAYFLLLEPSINDIDKIGSKLTMNAFPNPSKGRTSISYTVQNEGKILIELRNEAGQVLKVIADEFHKSGKYTKDVNFTDLQNQSYFISISDGESILTEKLIIQK